MFVLQPPTWEVTGRLHTNLHQNHMFRRGRRIVGELLLCMAIDMSSATNQNVRVKFQWFLKVTELTRWNRHRFCVSVLVPWLLFHGLLWESAVGSLSPPALWLVLGSGLSLRSGSLPWSLTQPHGVEMRR